MKISNKNFCAINDYNRGENRAKIIEAINMNINFSILIIPKKKFVFYKLINGGSRTKIGNMY